MRLPMLCVAVVALLAPMASAQAMPPARAGLLECQGGRNVGLVLGSVASLDCVFRSSGRRPEVYVATVRRFGLDLGITQRTKLTWKVNGPSSRFERGELAGTYGGIGANASMGGGGGGNLLVGGFGNAYALQPLSVQGQTGFNVAAGVAGIELEPFWYGRRSGRWHRSPSHFLHTMPMIR
jgi:Protein of unknown function (DUF992)